MVFQSNMSRKCADVEHQWNITVSRIISTNGVINMIAGITMKKHANGVHTQAPKRNDFKEFVRWLSPIQALSEYRLYGIAYTHLGLMLFLGVVVPNAMTR